MKPEGGRKKLNEKYFSMVEAGSEKEGNFAAATEQSENKKTNIILVHERNFFLSSFTRNILWARKCENVFKSQRIFSRLKLDFPVSFWATLGISLLELL